MQLATELEVSLREFAANSSVEVRENGGRISALGSLSWEVRGAADKPLLHLWSDQHNVTRRVLAITDNSEQRLALAVQRFGRSRPDRLEFVRTSFDRSIRDVSREEFCRRFERILLERFPDDTVQSLTASSDLEHSLSGNYARGIMRSGSGYWAVLGVSDGESQETAENSLTFGLLWLDRVSQSCRDGFIAGLRLMVPHGASGAIAHRVQALNPKLNLELYEFDAQRESLERVDPCSTGNLNTWLVPRRETQSLSDEARSAVQPIVGLSPKTITVHAIVQSRQVWLRFRGLAFARWDDRKVFFGIPEAREKLTSASWPSLKRLVNDLEFFRHPLATDTRHSLYRSQAERWLESIVREDVTRINVALDPRFVYSQVFANVSGEHGILDLLAVSRSGRLAILELKANEHLHLPLQAADYWLRIRRHLAQDDFSRYGYFSGIRLQPASPVVYLVAPLLRFHPATDVLLRGLSPELHVVRVGLAENWRCGLRVVRRL